MRIAMDGGEIRGQRRSVEIAAAAARSQRKEPIKEQCGALCDRWCTKNQP